VGAGAGLSPGWHSLGGQIVGPPAVVEIPPEAVTQVGQPLFIAVGTDHEVWERTLTTGWASLGGQVIGGVAAVALR
jgi:hypothetical protein